MSTSISSWSFDCRSVSTSVDLAKPPHPDLPTQLFSVFVFDKPLFPAFALNFVGSCLRRSSPFFSFLFLSFPFFSFLSRDVLEDQPSDFFLFLSYSKHFFKSRDFTAAPPKSSILKKDHLSLFINTNRCFLTVSL